MASEGWPSSDIDIFPNKEASGTKVNNPSSIEIVFGVEKTVSGLRISRFIFTNLVDCDNLRCSAVEVLKTGSNGKQKVPLL